MLTEKENFLMTLRGETPEWIPTYSIVAPPPGGPTPTCIQVSPGFLQNHRKNFVGGIDPFGVEYVYSDAVYGATMPKTSDFILKDIRKWRDVIKAPDISGYDWARICREDIQRSGIDRSQTALALDLHFGYFQNLMAFMGFTEGLCAIYEEPEECRALADYLCDFYCSVCEHIIEYYDPDVISIKDDTAAWGAPFMSPEAYAEIFLPQYDRQAKFGRDRGLPITFHNCGKCETYLEMMRSIGTTLWEPCQTCNDLPAIKKKYGNSLVLGGGWDARGRFIEPDCTDEEIMESVRSTILTLAEGGGYCFMGGYMGIPGDELSMHRSRLVRQVYEELRCSIYRH